MNENKLTTDILRSNIESILDWAERDQDECRQCGDVEGELEARENLRMIAEMRPLLLEYPSKLEAAKNQPTTFLDATILAQRLLRSMQLEAAQERIDRMGKNAD